MFSLREGQGCWPGTVKEDGAVYQIHISDLRMGYGLDQAALDDVILLKCLADGEDGGDFKRL